MRTLVLTPKFKRAFRKFTHNNPALRKRIEETLKQMADDVFASKLSTHKLSGRLYGLWACSCGYDCRIVFILENQSTDEEQFVILLLDIGTHSEVY